MANTEGALSVGVLLIGILISVGILLTSWPREMIDDRELAEAECLRATERLMREGCTGQGVLEIDARLEALGWTGEYEATDEEIRVVIRKGGESIWLLTPVK